MQDARHSYCFPVLPVLLLQRTVSSLFGTTINQTRHDLSHYLKTPTFTTTFALLASTLPRTCFKNRLCPIEPFRSTVDPCLATRQRQSRPDPARSLQAQPLARSLAHSLSCTWLCAVRVVPADCTTHFPASLSHRHLRLRHRHQPDQLHKHFPPAVSRYLPLHGSPCYQHLHLLPHRLPHNTQYHRNITSAL